MWEGERKCGKERARDVVWKRVRMICGKMCVGSWNCHQHISQPNGVIPRGRLASLNANSLPRDMNAVEANVTGVAFYCCLSFSIVY